MRGAGSRGEPWAYTHRRTSGNARVGLCWQHAGQPWPRPGPPPLSSAWGPPVKPDASRSFAAGGSTGPAERARSGPRVCSGSAAPPHAASRVAPVRGTRQRSSSAGRGHSRCKPALRPGSTHTRTIARGDEGCPFPQQQASTPSPNRRVRRSVAAPPALDESAPSVQYCVRTRGQHGGARCQRSTCRCHDWRRAHSSQRCCCTASSPDARPAAPGPHPARIRRLNARAVPGRPPAPPCASLQPRDNVSGARAWRARTTRGAGGNPQ